MSNSKKASEYTINKHNSWLDSTCLAWDDDSDFESARKGFIGCLEDPVIYDHAGNIVYDLRPYHFLEQENAPFTVNPSLWRQARLNMFHGLFRVTDRIFQVRGYDLSVMSIIEGDTGYIIIDPLVSMECAKASIELVYRHIGKKPTVAVIYTHTHVDHWGGVKGVVSESDVTEGRIKIIAPEGFMEMTVSENIIAGNVMGRRAAYQSGSGLDKGPSGQVDSGLGKTASNGHVSLIPPTDIISETGSCLDIDGIEIIFQNTPGTEAPAEFNFYFPQFKALCMAENCTHTMHNLYTPRGAEVRDAKVWARFINESIEMFSEKTDVIFASHHWPTWGREKCINFLKSQRDMYKYLHDETMRLANHGYTMLEIAESVELPPSLSKAWYNRGYWGSVSHNVRGIYQKYLGWFDGNPANLNPLPPEAAGEKYVEFMGGPEETLAKARKAFNNGEYRWTAQVVNHLIFACPDNMEARHLQADTFEQLGYQAESSIWRNLYLQGAKELREGVANSGAAIIASADAIKALNVSQLFDYMSICLNGALAAEKITIINFNFTDTGQISELILENGVLNYKVSSRNDRADVQVSTTRATLCDIVFADSTLNEKQVAGEIHINGNEEKFYDFLKLFDRFDFWFNIVTP